MEMQVRDDARAGAPVGHGAATPTAHVAPHERPRRAVLPDSSIHQAIRALAIDGTCAVVDGAGRLVATVTDWEIRRGLLRGVELDEPVSAVMNRACPVAVARPGPSIPVVIMAGGAGTRLRPYTLHCPKPLVEVGGRPLLETTVRRLERQGFRHICLAVGAGGAAIRRHFGDGSALGVRIEYLEEDAPRGTAGALGLLRTRPVTPLLVVNADLLTGIHFDRLIEFHERCGGPATMCVRRHEQSIPFGVIQLQGTRVSAVREKPVQRFFINAGVYVLDPPVLDLVPPTARIDMPAVLNALVSRRRQLPAAFPLYEYWLDVGDPAALERASIDIQRMPELTRG